MDPTPDERDDAIPAAPPKDSGVSFGQGPDQWDRRSHRDRRRYYRRRLQIPVATDRRLGGDRRKNPRYGRRKQASSAFIRLSVESARRLSGVAAVLDPPLLGQPQPEAQTDSLLAVRHGLAASTITAWERVGHVAGDGGTYRSDRGAWFRRIGSALLPLHAFHPVERADALYEAEFHRAYEAVYARYPVLRGISEERSGLVIVRAPLNDLINR